VSTHFRFLSCQGFSVLRCASAALLLVAVAACSPRTEPEAVATEAPETEDGPRVAVYLDREPLLEVALSDVATPVSVDSLVRRKRPDFDGWVLLEARNVGGGSRFRLRRSPQDLVPRIALLSHATGDTFDLRLVSEPDAGTGRRFARVRRIDLLSSIPREDRELSVEVVGVAGSRAIVVLSQLPTIPDPSGGRDEHRGRVLRMRDVLAAAGADMPVVAEVEVRGSEGSYRFPAALLQDEGFAVILKAAARNNARFRILDFEKPAEAAGGGGEGTGGGTGRANASGSGPVPRVPTQARVDNVQSIHLFP
jgi:hypothetical protein